MQSTIIATTADHISSGGTITGDLTISGDLTVSGSGGAVFDEIIEGSLHIITASAGTITDEAFADDLIIENSGTVGISIRCPDANRGTILFQSATNDRVAAIKGEYNSGSELLTFAVNDANRMIIDENSRISLSNNDSSGAIGVTLLGYQAGNVIASGDINNTMIGHMAGLVTTGASNTYVGFSAGKGDSGAEANNVGVGKDALFSVSTGSGNVVIGREAGYTIAAQASTVLIGDGAGSALNHTDADGTVAVGASALNALTSGVGNVAVGYQTLDAITSVGYCTAIGHQALSAACGADSTAVGYQALMVNTRGDNTAIGKSALVDMVTGFDNTAVGSGAMGGDLADDTADASEANVAVGKNALGGDWVTAASNNNTAIGSFAMGAAMDGALNNTAVGYSAMSALTTGDGNVAVGKGSLAAVNTGSYNIGIGEVAGQLLTGAAGSNVLIGYNVMSQSTAGIKCVFIGADAGADGNITTAAEGSVGIGHSALKVLTSGAGNTAVGYQSLLTNTDASNNTMVGYQSGYRTTGGGSGNTVLGTSAFSGSHTGSDTDDCVAIGYLALSGALADADGTVAIGKSALAALTSGAGNTAVGNNAGAALIGGGLNTILGYEALDLGTTVNNSIAIGHSAMGSVPADQAVEFAIAIGNNAMLGASATTGINGNVAIGYAAGALLTSGGGNVLIGYSAGDVLTTGQNNTILGRHTLGAGNGDEDDNTLIGYTAGDVIDNGNQITCLGSGTDPSTAAGANQTVIGYGTTGQADNSVTLGNASVTAVYMGSDSGAQVLCERLTAKRAGVCNVALNAFSTTAGEGATVYLSRSNHASIDSYAAVDANDVLGEIIFQGSDTDSLEQGGTLKVQAAETWDADSRGSQFVIKLVPSGVNSTTLADRLTISGDGNVGIGVAATYRLDIHDDTTDDGGYMARFTNDGDNANRLGIIIKAGADDASGTTRYLLAQDGDGGTVGYLANTSGTFALTDGSDRRIKDNIRDTEIEGLSAVNSMQVRDFEWKKSGDTCIGGLVAQELKEVFSPAVSGEEDDVEEYEVSPSVEASEGVEAVDAVMGERPMMMGVSRDRLVPVLIKAIQELSAKVEALENA